MQHGDTLLSIAEIAVALAGFTSLVTVLGSRQDRASRARDRSRLQVMLELGLRNAAFAVIPLPFLEAGASEPALWRIMSGFYLLAMAGHVVLQNRRGQGLALWGASSLRVSLVAVATISAVASAANVLGVHGSSSFSLYVASLVLGLVFAGLIFLSVASSVFRAEDTSSE